MKGISALIRALFTLFIVMSVAAQEAPPTPKRPVESIYHGITITDDYQWLENFSDPQVRQWVAKENQYTRSVLDKIPGRSAVQRELETVFNERATTYSRLETVGERVFAIKFASSRQQPELVAFPSLANGATEKTVLDPLRLDPRGHTEIDFYKPSLDGRYVAVSLSRLGSEAGDVHIYEVATGRELVGDLIPRVNNGTAGGSVAWNGSGSGFYYTRYPRAGERAPADLAFYQQVYFHKLGTSTANDQYQIGKDFPRIAEIVLNTSPDGKWILATVQNGDGGDYFHVIHGPDNTWHQITHYADQISMARFGTDDSLYLLSRQNAPMQKLLRLSTPTASLKTAATVVPQSDVAIENFMPATGRIYVVDMAGGPSQIRVFALNGRFLGKVPLNGIVSVNGIERWGRRNVLFATSGYIEPIRWFTCSSSKLMPDVIAPLSPPSPISYNDAEVVRDFAISKDGTRIPLNIIRLKGTKLDGRNPVLMTGYGGFGISETPRPNVLNRVLLDHGFVIVDTNLRGGSEYGEEWHLAGKLTHKQNVFDDFYACAQYLGSHEYTTPARFAIMGGSNGGLLMGAELTQHPEMYRVVLAFVGIYDMLRAELSPNGAFNVTEYGTVKEADQFRALYAYSPYHHVISGKRYPAAIFLTGDNDPRVDPANSRKMVAKLQAVDNSKGPILLRTTSEAGHGIGSSLSVLIGQYTDAFSFLFDQLRIR